MVAAVELYYGPGVAQLIIKKQCKAPTTGRGRWTSVLRGYDSKAVGGWKAGLLCNTASGHVYVLRQWRTLRAGEGGRPWRSQHR